MRIPTVDLNRPARLWEKIVFFAIIAASVGLGVAGAVQGEWGITFMAPAVFGAAFMLPRPLGTNESDFAAIERQYRIDERRRQIRLRAQASAFVVGLTVLFGLFFAEVTITGHVPWWVGAGYGGALVVEWIFTLIYSRSM